MSTLYRAWDYHQFRVWATQPMKDAISTVITSMECFNTVYTDELNCVIKRLALWILTRRLAPSPSESLSGRPARCPAPFRSGRLRQS